MPLLVILFIVVPIAELFVIIQVGQAIGVLPTIGLLLLDSVAGSWLMRHQGRATWRRFSEALRAGRPPAGEVIDGALVLMGGAFLLTPGFLTEILGAAVLVPPSRALVRRVLARRFLGRMTASLGAPARGGPRRSRPYDIEGTASDPGPDRR
ncbi:MAG: FxsA family protein [Solirubrobacteraceae bacterium]